MNGHGHLDALRSGLADHLAKRRAERSAAERGTDWSECGGQASALTLAKRTGRDRADAAALDSARRRDEWRAANSRRLDGGELLRRVSRAVLAALPADAPDATTDDVTAWLTERVIARHGPEPLARDVADSWLRTRAAGAVLNMRADSARRADSLDALQEQADALADDRRERPSGAKGRDLMRAVGSLAPAPELPRVEADARTLAKRLGGGANVRLALALALRGYGAASEYAERHNVPAATVRKHAQRGRRELHDAYPTAALLLQGLAPELAVCDRAVTLTRRQAAHRSTRPTLRGRVGPSGHAERSGPPLRQWTPRQRQAARYCGPLAHGPDGTSGPPAPLTVAERAEREHAEAWQAAYPERELAPLASGDHRGGLMREER